MMRYILEWIRLYVAVLLTFGSLFTYLFTLLVLVGGRTLEDLNGSLGLAVLGIGYGGTFVWFTALLAREAWTS